MSHAADHGPVPRWVGVCLDSADAERSARCCADVLGWEVTGSDGRGWRQLRDPAGGVGLNVQTQSNHVSPVWPDRPGAQQRMMHFEVEVDDQEAGVRRVVDAGGAPSPYQPPDRDPTRLMLDPTAIRSACS